MLTVVAEPDVAEAARWLDGRVVRTPVLRSAALDELCGVRIWLKAENLQVTGLHKFRGALRAVARAQSNGAAGVITQSSGNHGIAIACAARLSGLPATIVLPFGASSVKVRQIERHDGRVIMAAASVEECRTTAEELAKAEGLAFVDSASGSPGGDADVIAGQGTASLELINDVPQLDALVVPAASGNSLAGATLAAQGRGIAVFGAEPGGSGALGRSLDAGHRVWIEPRATIADALPSRSPGGLPYEIITRNGLAGTFQVTDEAIRHAVTLLLFHTKTLVEPSGAIGLAALLVAPPVGHRDVGVVLTGGNIQQSLAVQLISDYGEPE